eukprot:Selendium_serpulae@DN7066_c0_g1_i1.p1
MRVSPSDVWSFKLALLKDDSSISVTNPLKLDLEESAWDWSTEFSIRGVQFDHELSRTSSYVWLANFWHPKITMEIEVENGHLESVAGDTNALALMAISHDLVELETHSIVLNEKNFDLTITFILCKDEQTQGGRIALLRGFNGMPMIPQNGSFSCLIVRAFMGFLQRSGVEFGLLAPSPVMGTNAAFPPATTINVDRPEIASWNVFVVAVNVISADGPFKFTNMAKTEIKVKSFAKGEDSVFL